VVMTRSDVQISIFLEKKVHNIAQLIAIGSSVPTYRRNTIKADAHLRFAHSPSVHIVLRHQAELSLSLSLELRQPIAEPCISFHRNMQSQGTVN
jgi:hypothetical protein